MSMPVSFLPAAPVSPAGPNAASSKSEPDGGARFDVHTCSACHNDQKRFGAGSHANDVDSPAVTANATADGGVWTQPTKLPVSAKRERKS